MSNLSIILLVFGHILLNPFLPIESAMFGESKFKKILETVPSTTASSNSGFLSPIIGPPEPERTGSSRNSLHPIKDIRTNEDFDDNVTSVISALLSAVLALVVLLLVIFIVQAIKRRRRERQGTLLNQPVIHAIAPPAFAPTLAAYTSRSGLTSSRFVTWENVADSSAPVLHPITREENRASGRYHHQRQQQQQLSANPVEGSSTDGDLSTSASTSTTATSSSASASSSSSQSQSFSCL